MLEEIQKDLKTNEKASPAAKDTEAILEALLRDSDLSSAKRENVSLTKSNQPNENENEGLFSLEDEIEPVRPLDLNQTEGEMESFRLDMDSFGSVEELCQRLQGLSNDENKISELQNLVTIQRKALTKLSKMNAEVLQTVRIFLKGEPNDLNRVKRIKSYMIRRLKDLIIRLKY